ncbi:MAG TPA: hypothetical protein VHZ75_08835, partial [Solirubrobacteraceae bacterium]|nr:hypothetical protein [Solirubrobacteraceae bacterium]
LSRAQLIGLAKSVQSKVEGMPFATWASAQHIFDTNQSTGCYIFQRLNQLSVDLYCVGDDGTVITQGGADVSLAIKGTHGASLFSRTANTSSYGFATFHPSLDPSAGRVQLTATSNTFRGPVTSTVYRQAADDQAGVFGVVTGAATGTISFSSPKKQFKTFSVPVPMVHSRLRRSRACAARSSPNTVAPVCRQPAPSIRTRRPTAWCCPVSRTND